MKIPFAALLLHMQEVSILPKQSSMISVKISVLKHVALRFFNVAGSHSSSFLGEYRYPPTHLIPIVINQAIEGQIIEVYGDDYPTKDGTCVRDYIHVTDVSNAILNCVKNQDLLQSSNVFNIGTNQSYSVLEVIKEISNCLNISIEYRVGPRRLGDVSSLSANCTLIERTIGWSSQNTLHDIVVSSIENIKTKSFY